jgi:hypothetical protein
MSVPAASPQCHSGLPKIDGITNITRLTRTHLNAKTVSLPSLRSKIWLFIDPGVLKLQETKKCWKTFENDAMWRSQKMAKKTIEDPAKVKLVSKRMN